MDVAKRKRRTKPASERKRSLIKVLVTADMKRLFEDAAESRGMTVSTWIRSVALLAAKGGDREGGS